jgi:hypothetical protein
MSTGALNGGVISPPWNGRPPVHAVHPCRWGSLGAVRPHRELKIRSRSPICEPVGHPNATVAIVDTDGWRRDVIGL